MRKASALFKLTPSNATPGLVATRPHPLHGTSPGTAATGMDFHVYGTPLTHDEMILTHGTP